MLVPGDPPAPAGAIGSRVGADAPIVIDRPAAGADPRPATAPAAAAPAEPAIALVPRDGPSRCAWCTEDLGPTARRFGCDCGVIYHPDCWSSLDRCGTLGCARQPSATERGSAGVCPACHVPLRGAFRWERGSCGACGAVYHLGCRAARPRCATASCTSGRHDRWGGAIPAPPPDGPALRALAALTRALTPAPAPKRRGRRRR